MLPVGNTKKQIAAAAPPKHLRLREDRRQVKAGGSWGCLYLLDPSKTFLKPWQAQRQKGCTPGHAGGEPPGPISPAWKL